MESCYHAIMPAELKRVGQSGQISVGRELAGKLLRLEQLEDGRLLLTPVVSVPESQLWTLSEPHKSRIERGLEWAAKTPAKETDVAALVAKARRRKKR
jgi:chromosomal replication initiation ATPase DnaA